MIGFWKKVLLVVLMGGLVCAVEPTSWFLSAKDYAKSTWSSWQKLGISGLKTQLAWYAVSSLGWYAMSTAYDYYHYHQWMSEYATVLEKEGNATSWLWNNPPPFGENPSIHMSMFKRLLGFVDNQLLSTVCEHMHLRRVKGKNDSATENKLFRTVCSE